MANLKDLYIVEDEKSKKDPISRREFFKKLGGAAIGATALGTGGVLVKDAALGSSGLFWQIDHTLCNQCGRCETECVLPISAVKCMHANVVCGYCDLCGGYYRTNVRDLNTAAENMMCPTGAIDRKFIEDPYFEYTINKDLCTGCAKCVKGCSSFGNGSLYLQIDREICVNCNECNIARKCPTKAVQRVGQEDAYNFKDHFIES